MFKKGGYDKRVKTLGSEKETARYIPYRGNCCQNGIYDIGHLNSRDSNAMKNHYLLRQISDIIMQIYLAWNPLFKEIQQNIKNTSSMLLESFRRLIVTDEDVFQSLRYTTVYLE